MSYSHTQHSHLHYVVLVAAIFLFLIAGMGLALPGFSFMFLVLGGVALTLSYSFRYLTVCDQGESLLIQFGPLPLFKKRIPYSQMTDVAVGQSSIIDGWGVHYVPGRGWTYNLWGFDCAIVTLGRKTIRVGSDDAENLVSFLKQKIAAVSSE